MTTALLELARSRELVWNLTQRELKGKYKRSVLGWGWSLVNPLATMAIYTLVFRFVLQVKAPPGERTGINVFALWLLCGLLPWNFVSSSISAGIGALVGNGNLIKKVYFPREALVASAVFALVITLGIELGVLAVALLLFGNLVLPWLPALALLVVLLTGFAMGIALGLSVLNVYFRDAQYFVGIFLQLWFYATPILYPVSYVRAKAGMQVFGVSVYTLYQLNPMAQFVEAFRDVLYDLRVPPLHTMVSVTGWAVASLVVGFLAFSRYQGRLAEEL